MAEWEVWRFEAAGRARLSEHDDRVEAVAEAVLAGGEVVGRAGPVCRTNRELYLRVTRLGEELSGSGRPLVAYLRSLWSVGQRCRDREEIDPDLFAAMLLAAARVEPPPPYPAWHTADLSADDLGGYELWERIIQSQVADLAEMPDPLPVWVWGGFDAPRPAGAGRRATWRRWYNFTPTGYLECAMAGSFGGWAEDDGTRIALPTSQVQPSVPPDPGLLILPPLSWDDLAEFALCGQTYE